LKGGKLGKFWTQSSSEIIIAQVSEIERTYTKVIRNEGMKKVKEKEC